MYQFSPATPPSYGITLMKKPKHGPPGPLGRIIKRKRYELGIRSGQALSDLTADHGLRVSQNTISRIESGATQTMHPEHLEVIAKVLGLGSNADFVLASHGISVGRASSAHDDPSGALVIPASQSALQELVRVASRLDQKRDVPRLTQMAQVFRDIPAVDSDRSTDESPDGTERTPTG